MVTRDNIEAFIEILCDAVILVDSSSNIVCVNGSCTKLFGYTKEQMQELGVSDLMDSEYSADHHKNVKEFVDSNRSALKMMNRDSLSCIDSQGEKFFARISISNIILDGQNYALATLHDFTTIEQRIDKLKNDSFIDVLSGFYNRRYLDDVVLTKHKNMPDMQNLGMLYIDIDRFKPINDTFGHTIGDLVIEETTRRIRCSLRSCDLLFRVGGDEFLVILRFQGPIEKKASILNNITNKLYYNIREPMLIREHTFTIELSMGAGLYPEHSDSLEKLILKSDKAMYYSKKSGEHVTFVN